MQIFKYTRSDKYVLVFNNIIIQTTPYKEKAGRLSTGSIIVLTFWIPPFYVCLSIQDSVCLELEHTDKKVSVFVKKNY